MAMIELVHIYLIIPKIIELILFLTAISTVSHQFHDIKWGERPLTHKLLVYGLTGWVVFISLDLFIFLFAGISFNAYTPFGVYTGYDADYPSLFIANILRDVCGFGLLVLLICYFIIPFNLRYGEKWTTEKITQNKGMLILFLLFTIILILGENVSAIISEKGIVLDATWGEISGVSIFLFIILFMISSIRFAVILNSSSSNFITGSYKHQIKFLQLGIFCIGFGFLFLFVMGMFKLAFPSFFESDIIRFLIHLLGHCFWITSPIFIIMGIRFPIEELNPENEDFKRIGMQKLREFIDNSFLGFLIFKDSNIIYANPKLSELFGYSKETIENWKMAEFFDQIHINDKNRVKEFFSDLQTDHMLQNFITYQINTNQNKSKWVQQAVNVFNLKNGQIIQSVIIDITEQKQLALRIEESEKKFQKLFLNTKDMIVQLDCDGLIVEINPAVLDILGYAKYELIGHDIAEIIAPSDRERLIEQWNIAIEQERTELIDELDLIKKNGMKITVENNFTFNYINGNLTFVNSITRDITGRKEIEKQRMNTQKLESIALLAGGIAHDYNNILASILGNINLLQLQSNLTSEAENLLHDLESATMHASSLTNQLLTFSKGGTPILSPTSIYDVIRDSASFALSGSNCNWKFTSTYEPIPQVNIDTNQISRVLNNIFINAVQAMPDGGTINLSVEKLVQENEGLELACGEYLVLSISDTGMGIPLELQDRLFEPYFTTKEKGSGLGLATCYSILKKHGGLITFTSKIHQGTTFFLYLPIIDAKMVNNDKNALHSFIPKANILIMDDNKDIQRVLGRMLTKLDMDCDIVDDGYEAIAKFQEKMNENGKYDLLIMDLTVPGSMGGREAMEEIYRLDPTVKAIVSSGFSEDVTLANYKEHHFLDILPKPYSLQKLREVLSKILNKKTNDHNRTQNS
ncbi:PAS domain S-box protein [Candidatus Lokiarchaeum ossiferum]|uniref:PAS domain S-box protein n=1 Tax=Candidatus Lokiarchaeum ossiferum TaxID=2951803 RepID=UPI00352BFC1A